MASSTYKYTNAIKKYLLQNKNPSFPFQKQTAKSKIKNKKKGKA
jgi:hypothetical protein